MPIRCFLSGRRSTPFLLLAAMLVWPKTARALAYSGIDFPQQVRAGYLSIGGIDLLAEMSRRGMNTALVKFGELRLPVDDSQYLLLSKWSNACRQNNLHFVIVLNLWGWDEPKWINPASHLYADKKEYPLTPCPLDQNFLSLIICQRLVRLAEISHQYKISGAIIDIEMYKNELRHFPNMCFCDNCISKFLQSDTSVDPNIIKSIPKERREKYFADAGLSEKFRAFSENYIFQQIIYSSKKIQEINPEFVLGAFHLERPWSFNKGLLRAFSGASLTVLAFTEQTYKRGYGSYIQETLNKFSDMKLNTKLVVGFWQEKWPISELTAQYYYCAKAASGYWVYDMTSLLNRQGADLRYSKNDYWRAIGNANYELFRLAKDPNYQSYLEIDVSEPFE